MASPSSPSSATLSSNDLTHIVSKKFNYQEPTEVNAMDKSYVILKVGEKETFYLFFQLYQNKKIKISRELCNIDNIINKKYGSTFILDRNIILNHQPEILNEYLDEISDINFKSSKDNRDLIDFNESQTLTSNEILNMKSQMSGIELVNKLAAASSTFANKTEFSQQKWLKKKQAKYCKLVTLLPSTSQAIAEAAFKAHPDRILSMRYDTLSQILHYCNIRAHISSTNLIVEGTDGLLTGAVAERQGGIGRIISLYNGKEVKYKHLYYLPYFHFNKHIKDIIDTLSLSNLKNVVSQKISFVKNSSFQENDLPGFNHIVKNPVTSLLVAIDSLVAGEFAYLLLSLLADGATFCIYSPTIAPLVDVYSQFRNFRLAANLLITETWHRCYQALPNRTHPEMSTSGGGGYILTGVKVNFDISIDYKSLGNPIIEKLNDADNANEDIKEDLEVDSEPSLKIAKHN